MAATRLDHRVKPFEFALSTGLRLGELCGLRWENVNWIRRTVAIQETVLQAGNREQVSTPKTRGSRRTLHMSKEAVALLRVQRQEQDSARLAMGDKGQESGRVFTTMNGRTLHPSSLERDMKRIYESAGVRYLKVHGLRHTYASL